MNALIIVSAFLFFSASMGGLGFYLGRKFDQIETLSRRHW